MATYLVHRCHYNNPSERALVTFQNDTTLLDWFRNRWEQYKTTEGDGLEKEFGFYVYGLGSIFSAANEFDLELPQDSEQLGRYLIEHLYTECDKRFEPHLLQVFTNDDELEQAYYLFDDQYLAENPDKVAFLMHTDWKLPTDFKRKGGFQPNARAEVGHIFGGSGNTYFAISECVDSANLDPNPPVVFPGVRLPEFPMAMFSVEPTFAWPRELEMIRSIFFIGKEELPDVERNFVEEIYQEPSNADSWLVYSDWLMEHQMAPLHVTFLERAFKILPGLKSRHEIIADTKMDEWQQTESFAEGNLDPNFDIELSKSKFAVSEHMAQICLHYDTWEFPNGERDIYHQWWLFDDCWASANQVLAQGLFQFCGEPMIEES